MSECPALASAATENDTAAQVSGCINQPSNECATIAINSICDIVYVLYINLMICVGLEVVNA